MDARRVLDLFLGILLLAVTAGSVHCARADNPAQQAAEHILSATGVKGGVVVHVGCGDGKLTAALRAGDQYVVQGLDRDPEDVARARRHLKSAGFYGQVTAVHWRGDSLPYRDNLVNLLVVADPAGLSESEMMRVLAPHGVACVKTGDGWEKTVKPWPDEIDEWTHYLHDAGGNPVSRDERVGPPKGLQWAGSPKWSRHHDHMSSVSAMVSANGRVFSIMDRGSRKSILLPPKWYLVARDAFNGTVLWERKIDTWRSPLIPRKSGPAQLPRRLVAMGDTVYVTPGIDAPVTALDAATGETLRTFEGTKKTREIILSDGMLFALADATPGRQHPEGAGELMWMRRNQDEWWSGKASRLVAFDVATGRELWEKESRVLPLTLAASGGKLCFHDGKRIVCLDANSGERRWASEPVERSPKIHSFFGPSLAIHGDTVIFAGGKESGLQTGGWLEKDDTMSALSLESGDVLWTAPHPPSGYRSPEDLFVIGDRVWAGDTTSGKVTGLITGRDLATGDLAKEFAPDVNTYWFHHRCYRGKATEKYLLMSRTGIEYVDPETGHWDTNHWVRGGCLYGIMPANGLTYAPPHPCACYMVASTKGFNALSPEPALSEEALRAASRENRLVKGPAYDSTVEEIAGPNDWPTYRHDSKRSGSTDTSVSTELSPAWRTRLGGDLTSVVVAGDKLFVAAVDRHTVYSLDTKTGKVDWSFTAGGRVDSPPTIWKGRALFGSADGWVYCLRASDGELIWKYRAAPASRCTMDRGQVESLWPVHGSVLVRDGTVYCVAGRSMFLDGGLRMLLLDAKTGRKLSEKVMDEKDPTTKDDLQAKVQGLNMPTALPDVLSCDGENIYMRAQKFDLKGERAEIETPTDPDDQQGESTHLFSANGFLDDSWFHRSYWVYGKTPLSGYAGYPRAARNAPAGRIISFDDEAVYSYGREPKYMRWTTPMEYLLFASPRRDFRGSNQGGVVQVENSPSLNPANTPLSVAAWVKPEKDSGAVAARGGQMHGYALYLLHGKPHFALRVDQDVQSVAADRRVANGEWTHLAAVVTRDLKLKIYVNGELAGTASTKGLVVGNPSEPMQIGADQNTQVGGYGGSLTFNGALDEVRVYREALNDDDVRNLSSRSGKPGETAAEPALYYAFDDGKARDLSGNSNHGKGDGQTVEGVFGKAMRFSGYSYPNYYEVVQRWARRVPLHARGMVLAGDTLFIGGPPDLVDEERAVGSIGRAETMEKLRRQDAAWQGQEGGLLWAIRPGDGEELATYELNAPPIFDGMAAADGRLYISSMDGTVQCMAPK